MDEKKSIDGLTNKGIITAKFRQKDWVKKLEAVSGKPVASFKSSGNVYLVVDCSGSMSEGNKINQAKKGALGYADQAQRKGYSVGLIKFASCAEHILEPQNKIINISSIIDTMTANGSTNMAAAIQMATDKLIDKTGDKLMCIVTDGMPDDKKAALIAADKAKKEHIDIMTIGTDDADKDFLEEIATRKELSTKVSRDRLEQGIISMAKMLPGKNE